MDTLTHALLGAACALALPTPCQPGGVSVAARSAAGATAATATATATATAARPGAGRGSVVWSPLQRAAIAAGAAAFPDLDFVLFPLDPLRFLADWHQGPTHALPMAPLWAALIAALACAWRRDLAGAGRGVWPRAALEAWGWALLGLASHALADLVTAYGLAWAWPLSGQRVALGITWVIDPLWTLPLAAGVGAAWRWRRAGTGRQAGRQAGPPAHRAWPAQLALGALATVAFAQAALHQRALVLAQAEAERRGLPAAAASARAQPLSPLHWQLLLGDGERYLVAHLALPGPRPMAAVITALPDWPGLDALQRLAGAYRPAEALVWHRHALTAPPVPDAAPPVPAALQPTTLRAVWNDPTLAAYRRFARFPALSRVDAGAEVPSDRPLLVPADTGADSVPDGREPGAACVWFTDLRYDLPGWPDTFRFGACRESADAPWVPHRLRYLRADARQRLR